MRTIEDLGISPAPWSVDESEYGDRNNVVCNYECDKFSNGEIRTKQVAGTNYHFKNSQADARLIAAAPELYRALREAVIEMCHDCPSCEGSENGYRCDDPAGRCFVQKWREVLAKAACEEAK